MRLSAHRDVSRGWSWLVRGDGRWAGRRPCGHIQRGENPLGKGAESNARAMDGSPGCPHISRDRGDVEL